MNRLEQRVRYVDLTGGFGVAAWTMLWSPTDDPEPQPLADGARRLATAARFIRAQGIPDVFFAQEIRDSAACLDLAGRLGDESPLPVVCP